MACIKLPLDQVSNALKNNKMFFKFNGKPEQSDIVQSFDYVREALSSEKTSDERYQTFDKGHVISKRVTEKYNRQRYAGMSEQEIKDMNEKYKHFAEFGTFIHSVMEDIGRSFVDGAKNIDWIRVRQRATNVKNPYYISEKQFEHLKSEMKKMIDEINSIQDGIDPNRKAEILFEQPIIEPMKDEAGTMDMVVVYSDNSADIIDFKTTVNRGDKLFNKSKINNFKLQMADYKNIIMKRHGIEKIRRGRVVPIMYNFKRNSTFVTDIQMGIDNNKRLEQIMVLPETTGIKALDKFVLESVNRLDQKDKKDYSEMKDSYRDLLNSLVVSRELKPISEFFFEIAKEAMDQYEKDGTLDYTMLQYIKLGEQFIEGMQRELNLASKDPKLKTQLVDELELVNNLQSLYYALEDIRLSNIVERIDGQLGTNISKEFEDTEAIVLKGDTFFARNFSRLSDLSNEVFRYFRKLLDKQQDLILQDVRKDEDLISDAHIGVEKWLKETGQQWSDFVNIIYNRDTENFYSQVASRFFKERNDAVKAGNYRWVTEHYEAKDGYSEKYAEMEKERRERLMERWNDEKVVEDKMEWFYENFNLELKTNGMPMYPKAWTSWKNVQIKDKYREDYKSEEYKKIESIPAVLEYYTVYTSLVQKHRKLLDLNYGKMPNNFVPFIRKGLLDRIVDNDGEGLLSKGTWEDIKKTFSIREDETGWGNFNEDTGKYEKSVPIYFTNPFRNDDGSLRKGEKSVDFTRSLLLFSKMAHNYQHMKTIEAHTLALKDVLANSIIPLRGTSGKVIRDEYGNMKPDDKLLKKHQHVLDALIDYYIYGETVQQKGRDVEIPLIGKVNTTKLLQKAKNYMSINKLGFGYLGGTASFTAAATQAYIEGRDGTIYTSEQLKMAIKDIGANRNKFFGLYHFFDVSSDSLTDKLSVNKKRNWIGNNLYSDKLRKFISGRAAFSAYRLGDEAIDAAITNAMARNFSVNKEGVVRRNEHVSGNEWKPIFEVLNYENDNITIEHVKPEKVRNMVIAFRKAVRSAQQGIKGTMTEEDQSYAHTDLALSTMMQFRSWMPGIVRRRAMRLQYEEDIDAIRWGKYRAFWTENNVADAHTFVDWVRQSFLPTLGQLSVDLTLGTLTLGKVDRFKYNVKDRAMSNEEYRKANEKWFEKFKELNPDQYEKLVDIYGSEEAVFEKMLEIKEKSIRGTLNELRIVALIFSLIMFFKGDIDDDDVPNWKENWATHKMFQVANRVYSELSFTFNPTELRNILRGSIFPISGLLNDFFNLTYELFDTPIDYFREQLTGEEDKRDKTDLWYRIHRMVPGLSQLLYFFDTYDTAQSSQK